MGLFKSFRSTVSPWVPETWRTTLRLLVDAGTGAPVGIESPNGSGPDGIFTPVDLTAAQIASPTAAMIADLNATYRLNVAPYTRYRSTGSALVIESGADSVAANGLTGAGPIYDAHFTALDAQNASNADLLSNIAVYGLTVDNSVGVTITGELRVYDYPV